MSNIQIVTAHPLWPFGSTLFSIILGALITWRVSRFYYIKSSEDLKKQLNLSLKVLSTMARFLEHSKMTEDRFIFNDEGFPVNILFKETVMRPTGQVEYKYVQDTNHKD